MFLLEHFLFTQIEAASEKTWSEYVDWSENYATVTAVTKFPPEKKTAWIKTLLTIKRPTLRFSYSAMERNWPTRLKLWTIVTSLSRDYNWIVFLKQTQGVFALAYAFIAKQCFCQLPERYCQIWCWDWIPKDSYGSKEHCEKVECTLKKIIICF